MDEIEKKFNLSDEIVYASKHIGLANDFVIVKDIKEFIKILKEFKIEIIKYPCDLEVCVKCNSIYHNQKVWFIYENKKYHFKCLLKKLAGNKLTE